jgi:hypothetical protein
MFRDLRTGRKLFILCSMFVIAIAVTMYSLVAEKLIAIEFAKKELVGSEYLAVVRQVYTSAAVQVAGSESAIRSAPPLDNVIAALQSVEAIAGGQLETTDAQGELAAALRRLAASDETTRASAAVDALARARALALRIGDDSNLTLDPDLDTYYLQHIAVSVLPAFLSYLGELEVLTHAAPESLPDDRRGAAALLAGATLNALAGGSLAHAGEAGFLNRFVGSFSGSGLVQRDASENPNQAQCTLGGQPLSNGISMSGSCRAFIFSRSIRADIRYDPASDRDAGVYVGSAIGAAKLSGRRRGNDWVLTIRWPQAVNGDTRATMTIRNSGDGQLAITITDKMQSNGRAVQVTSLALVKR